MPQMAPLMWLMVFLFMISIFLTSVIKLYFEKATSTPNETIKDDYLTPRESKLNQWKW